MRIDFASGKEMVMKLPGSFFDFLVFIIIGDILQKLTESLYQKNVSGIFCVWYGVIKLKYV